MHQSNQNLYIHPSPHLPTGQPPGFWIFRKFLFKFPPHRAEKLFKCPTPGKITRLLFYFSVASIMAYCFWNCACKYGLLDNTYLYIIKYKSFINTFKYGTQLV